MPGSTLEFRFDSPELSPVTDATVEDGIKENDVSYSNI